MPLLLCWQRDKFGITLHTPKGGGFAERFAVLTHKPFDVFHAGSRGQSVGGVFMQ